MIYDHISNTDIYKGLSKNLDTALDFLHKHTDKLEPGKLVIDGDNVFVNIVTAETKAQEISLFEFHKKYIDIHFIIEGEEKILISNINGLEISTEYSERDDYGLQKGPAELEILMKKGRFCIVFPGDSHMPLVMNREKQTIRKGIIKVMV